MSTALWFLKKLITDPLGFPKTVANWWKVRRVIKASEAFLAIVEKIGRADK